MPRRRLHRRPASSTHPSCDEPADPPPDRAAALARRAGTRYAGALLAVVTLLLVTAAPASAQTPGDGGQTGGWHAGAPTGEGVHLAIWLGGPVDQAAASVPGVMSLWTAEGGEFVGYSPGAPAFVNAEFLEVFPGGDIPSGTPLVVVVRAGETAPPPPPPAQGTPEVSTSSLDFGEVCVWCSESLSLQVSADGGVTLRDIRVTGEGSEQFIVRQSCAQRTLPGGQPCPVEVAFEPFRPDRGEARLEVHHAGPGSPLVVPLSGFGDCERPAQQAAILDEAVGYGHEARGGADGCLVHVTSTAESGEGSLREAATRRGPAWIVFDVSGAITLDEEIYLEDDKTVDGRGAGVEIVGAGLHVVDTANVIISDIAIHDSDGDGIHLRGTGTTDVWVRHVVIANIADGYIDVTQGATDITISWSRFDHSPDWPQEKGILIGANDPGDPDENSRVTIHHNLFNGLEQRNPLLRGGTVHTFNNYFKGWGIYGSGVGEAGQLLSERNVYAFDRSAPGQHAERAFTRWGAGEAYIRSTGDRFLGGVSGDESNSGEVAEPEYPYATDAPTDILVDAIMASAGPAR
ncbi:MAG: polysaccharide lyase family 1 protein [Dehalococcoidia bacterium]